MYIYMYIAPKDADAFQLTHLLLLACRWIVLETCSSTSTRGKRIVTWLPRQFSDAVQHLATEAFCLLH